MPPYPGGWGKQHATMSPPPAPPEDNPQLYGWEPSLYPDPLVDPVRCGVAYLPQQISPFDEDGSTASSSSSVPLPLPSENETTTAAQAAPNNSISHSDSDDSNESSLRLCDPDWVLGESYLEEIASALSNFSALYGDWATVHTNYWRRLRSLRRLDGPEAQHFSIEAASSEDGGGGSGSTTKTNTGPAIELAVATVRKVCTVLYVGFVGYVYVLKMEIIFFRPAEAFALLRAHDTA